MKRVLIKCGWLVTLDDAIGDFKGGELLYSGNRIAAVGRRLDATADEVIDASDKIVMPGLVNAHMHTWETALRGIAAEWLSPNYMAHIHGNLATRYRPEDNYLGNLLGALGQIDGGTTTLVDWCHNITTLEHAERAIDGLVDGGIRAVFAHGTAKPPTKPGDKPFTHVPHPRERIEALRKGRLASEDGRVTLAMAILGPDYSVWEVVEHDIRLAREFGRRLDPQRGRLLAHGGARQRHPEPDRPQKILCHQTPVASHPFSPAQASRRTAGHILTRSRRESGSPRWDSLDCHPLRCAGACSFSARSATGSRRMRGRSTMPTRRKSWPPRALRSPRAGPADAADPPQVLRPAARAGGPPG